ncbi:MAG TPA: phosphatase PAP2 family protein [Candidatus Limnocylindrales bacterium]
MTEDAPPAELNPADDGSPARLGRRNDRILLWSIGGYIVFLSVLMIVKGVSITPDVLLVGLALAAVVIGRGRLFLRDWIPFIGLFLAYELMRGYADDFGASIHVADFVAIDRFLGFGTLPTQILQDAFHPATGTDWLAIVSTIFYFLHFPLPLAVGFFLWLRRRRVYYDFVAAIILLSMAAFVTYLIVPVGPPWYAADHGLLNGPNGQPAILYLKSTAFDQIAQFFGFQGNYLYSYAMYDINPNDVAAFPSLHAAYPTLAFLFTRRAFGRVGYVMIGYAACVWFAVIYLGDHYLIDVLAGILYAVVAYLAVTRAPGWFRRVIDRAADAEIEASVDAPGVGVRDGVALGRLNRRIRWSIVGQGIAIGVAGSVVAAIMLGANILGGYSAPFYLVPSVIALVGLWRVAMGVFSS